MNSDDFEKRLQRQPLRQIPPTWRDEILRTVAQNANRNPKPETGNISFLSSLNSKLSTILWPNPKAWAGLAAVWLALFVLHFGSRENLPQMAKKPAPLPAEMMAGLKD